MQGWIARERALRDRRRAAGHRALCRRRRRDQGRTLWEITVEIDEQANPNFYRGHRCAAECAARRQVGPRLQPAQGRQDPHAAVAADHDQQILRDIYTPGVARVCLAIRDDPAKASLYTNRPNTVAVVTNGTAVLGLGDIGPVAGLPVMEGKAALFAALVGITAVPILIDSRDPARIIETVTAIAPSFGAIQLEDIAAPECFEIEAELVRRLDRSRCSTTTSTAPPSSRWRRC